MDQSRLSSLFVIKETFLIYSIRTSSFILCSCSNYLLHLIRVFQYHLPSASTASFKDTSLSSTRINNSEKRHFKIFPSIHGSNHWKVLSLLHTLLSSLFRNQSLLNPHILFSKFWISLHYYECLFSFKSSMSLDSSYLLDNTFTQRASFSFLILQTHFPNKATWKAL